MTVDRWALMASALCVAGLAIVLASLSYYTWLAHERGTSRWAALTRTPFTVFWSTGMFLTASGWGLLRHDHLWEVAICVVVAASFLVDLAALLRRAR